jgi:hypothetical protein
MDVKRHLELPEKRPRMRWDAAMILLTAAALLSMLLFLNMRALLKTPFLPNAPGQTWLELDPLQCGSNPWETNWDSVQSNLTNACQAVCSQPDAPGCPVSCLVTAYYQSIGITIHSFGHLDFKTKFGKDIELCEACTCPAGYTIYVRVADEDVSRMQALGFRHVVHSCAELPLGEQPYGCR